MIQIDYVIVYNKITQKTCDVKDILYKSTS